ncbi:uncharacterized protein BYT42DRAFT_647053 [Radiomyces spectabilis]|uniref:uncharacterized protein n=1 Tax=Radiomyces spectabilis TaxID=64574 RepID=UPI002220C79C|nr:uncharacterized protein BYT42DRAFT_647053 [Radiomyces spectabilis]KAI8373113.1 hypothetical protein BYT42DRAFT_647053 [Radiomyces spectabilis]
MSYWNTQSWYNRIFASNAATPVNQHGQMQQGQVPVQQQQQQAPVQEPQTWNPPSSQPSSHVPSAFYETQQQSQQRQAAAARAAASIVSALRTSPPEPEPSPLPTPVRGVIAYGDLQAVMAGNSTLQTVIHRETGSQCCGRWYKTESARAQHQKLHVKCPECTFSGLKSVLEQHKADAHGDATAATKKKRVDGIMPANAPQLDTPEALDAWIAARKKNWPSAANLERKKREAEEREARGEVVANGKRRAAETQSPMGKAPETLSSKRQKTDDPMEGSSNMGLVGDYGSDSDEEFHSAEEDPDNGNDTIDLEKDAISSKDPHSMGKIALPTAKPKKRLCRYFMEGRCKRGDQCHFAHDEEQKKLKQEQKKPTPPAQPVRKQPNLLRKLLDKEINTERNIILQGFRYITENNFFGLQDS